MQYITADIGIASVLLTKGFKLTGMNKNNPKRVFFEFKEEENMDQCLMAYTNGQCEVDAYTFYSNLKMLKNRIANFELN